MDKYVCSICGYEYDPQKNNDVEFKNLPEDYSCPECGVSKDMFDKV